MNLLTEAKNISDVAHADALLPQLDHELNLARERIVKLDGERDAVLLENDAKKLATHDRTAGQARDDEARWRAARAHVEAQREELRRREAEDQVGVLIENARRAREEAHERIARYEANARQQAEDLEALPAVYATIEKARAAAADAGVECDVMLPHDEWHTPPTPPVTERRKVRRQVGPSVHGGEQSRASVVYANGSTNDARFVEVEEDVEVTPGKPPIHCPDMRKVTVVLPDPRHSGRMIYERRGR